MSLLATASLIILWCTLEVANSQMVIPPPPIGNQYQDPTTFSIPVNPRYQTNNTSQDDDASPNRMDGKTPYTVFYMEKDQVRCEECDEKGNIRGNMTYVDGKRNAIRTVKYETTDIPLDQTALESAASSPQPVYSGAQDGYQQPFIQGQQLLQGQQLVQSQQPQMMGQPQFPYGQPLQAQGNQAVFGQMTQQQNPVVPQLPIPPYASNMQSQSILGNVQVPSTYGNTPYAPSNLFPYTLTKSLPEPVSTGINNQQTNQGLGGWSNPQTIQTMAAEAMRNFYRQPVQATRPTIQPAIPVQQPLQPQVLSDNSYGDLVRHVNLLNGDGAGDKPQGPQGPWYPESFSYKREQNGEQNIPASSVPAVLPMILVPQSGVLGQQLPLTLVAAGSSPSISNTDTVDKTVSKDNDSNKPSDSEMTNNMLQALASQIAAKISQEKSASEGIVSPLTGEGDLPSATR